MAEDNLTRSLGDALSIDFVERFGSRVKSLKELLGVQRVMPMAAGTLIKTYTSSVTLSGEDVGPGEVIPLSEVKMEEGPTQELKWKKDRKAVPMEDIQKYGFEKAITRTDSKFLNAIQRDIRSELFEQLATGTGATQGDNLQEVLAKNWAAVVTAFDEDDVDVISFINPNDAAEYLANAQVTVQREFGMQYLQDFLSNKVVFMHGDVPEGTVYSTASDNLVIAYADMTAGEIGQAFDFQTDSTGLIGVTHDINKQRLQSETITAYGIVLFAERLDGVVVGTIGEAPEDDDNDDGTGDGNGDGTPEG